MRAVLTDGAGGPEALRVGHAPDPVAGPGQVVIEVAATSVNRADISQRQGRYPPPEGESEILGLEVAGTVAELGAGVDRVRVGDRVMTLVGGGGYAERAAAYASHLMPIPESVSFEEAACIPEAYITAYLNVFLEAGLEDGHTVLLHGGGGGVNTAAIQLCRTLLPDVRIVVTASTGKVERVRALGVHRVVDYTSEEFATAVREYTEGRGADVILDHIGAPYLAPNLKALATGGRLVVIGVMGGVSGELNLARLMVKRHRIIGSVLRARSVAEKAAITERFARTVVPHFAEGRIAPLIHAVHPLEEAADAHRAMEASAHFGKIVLAPEAARRK